MKKSILKATLFIALSAGSLALAAPGHSVIAQSDDIQKGVNSISDGPAPSFMSIVTNGVNTFLFIIGAIAVLMIIYGGFKYVTSAGDSTALSSAKNTILYAVVGLVVAIAAYAIASFVVDTFSTSNSAVIEIIQLA